MALSDFVNLVEDFAQIAVTILLVYVTYKIARLIDAVNAKIKTETSA